MDDSVVTMQPQPHSATAPLPWRDPLFTKIVTNIVAVVVGVYLSGFGHLVAAVPGWWLWFTLIGVVYPSYLLYVIRPYTRPSLSRTVRILAPVFVLALIARAPRVSEQWGFEITHLAIGAIVFSFKKAPEFAINRVDRSVVTRWHRFLVHYIVPADIAFVDDPVKEYTRLAKHENLQQSQRVFHQFVDESKADPVTKTGLNDACDVSEKSRSQCHLPSDDTLTADEFAARYLNVRQRGIRELITAMLWALLAVPFAIVILYLHYHHDEVLQTKLIGDGLAGIIIASFCSALFHLLAAVVSLMFGDGFYCGSMWDNILRSTSLRDFWRRWNRGMRDVFYHCCYRPLGGRRNPVVASLAVGVYASLLHEYEVWLNVGHTNLNMVKFFMAHVCGVMAQTLVGQWCPRLRVSDIVGRVVTAMFLLVTVGYFIGDFGLTYAQIAEKALGFWTIAVRLDWPRVEALLSAPTSSHPA